jgi:signal transduction histidine kinase
MVLVFGLLVTLLVATAVGAVWTLQAMLSDLRVLSSHRWVAVEEVAQLTSRFRFLVLALSVVFLVLINASVVGLLRLAGMVLRPVDKLVAASRALAHEQFDHRVEVDQHDEFDELAHAYNRMAEQLAVNERRKLEMLQQTALTLNHELNNATAIIDLQLQLQSRQACGAPAEKYARQIRESLARMTRTVDLLKHVRRIVLTDYVSGVKMLDLERSARDSDESEGLPSPQDNPSREPVAH